MEFRNSTIMGFVLREVSKSIVACTGKPGRPVKWMFTTSARRTVPCLLSRSSVRVALALSLAARASTSYAFVVLPSARATAKQSSTLVSRADRFLVEISPRRSKSSLGSMSAAGPPGDGGAVASQKFTVAACQILCGEDKAANIASAEKAVRDAAAAGAQVIVLPECWNSPYDTASFPVYAEPVPEPGRADGPLSAEESPSSSMLCRVAAENKVFVVGGSVPEVSKDGGGVYNTCIVVDADGRIVAKHRKVHLFDIDVPGGIRFKESDTLSPGNSITTVDTPYGVIGVAICYDMRFPELSIAMRDSGAVLLCYPGAFNMTTGPAHWELLQRARALDNQCYVVTASPARNPNSKYQAWGHSSVVDPWGTVVATTEHESAMVIAEVDIGKVSEVRKSIPVSIQKRTNLYKLQVF